MMMMMNFGFNKIGGVPGHFSSQRIAMKDHVPCTGKYSSETQHKPCVWFLYKIVLHFRNGTIEFMFFKNNKNLF
jgi:hypothetical protein